MKLKKLSLYASSAILGAAVLVGCGSDSSSSAATSGINAADGYVIDLNGTNATAFCSDTNTTYQSTLTVGAKGALTFNGVTLNKNCTVTVQANAFIDTDNSGDFNSSIDKQVGFAMKAPGHAKYVSHLTTLAVESNNTALLNLVADYDPVAAADDAASDNNATKQKAQKLLVLGDILKTALKAGGVETIKNINVDDIVDENKSVDDINTTVLVSTLPQSVKTAAKAKADATKQIVVKLKEFKDKGLNVNKLFVEVSDGGKKLEEAFKSQADVNTSDLNVSDIDSAIDNANTEVNNLPTKLNMGTILKVGSETVVLNGNKFTHTINTNDKNISDFYNITLPSTTVTKNFTADDVTLSLGIKDSNSNKVMLTIPATLSTDDNRSVKVTVKSGSSIYVSQTGLSALTDIGIDSNPSGSELSGNDLVMTDLGFNVNTIISKLNNNKVSDALNVLNGYLSTAGNYDVNLTLSGLDTNLTTDYTTILGTVKVENTKGSTSTPTTPDTNTTTPDTNTTTPDTGITDTFASFNAAVDNSGNAVSTTINNFTVKVFSDANLTTTSNGTIAIYGTIDGTSTGAALKLNDTYSNTAKFAVKVYDANNTLVAISQELSHNATAINFGALTTSK
jgi:hypothetical protein